MNFYHMKYALVISQTNSINKAAEELYVGAPALSRAIKELESNLGVTLFERSAKGMFLTPDGEVFIRYARKILKQVDDVETIFREGSGAKKSFSISVPGASYIAEAFVEFSKKVNRSMEAEIYYNETNASKAIKNIEKEGYKLCILRYEQQYENYYQTMLEEKNLDSQLIAEFRYELLISKNSELSKKDVIALDDLKDYMEITYADLYVPTLPFSEIKKTELSGISNRRIFLFERCSQFELLAKNPETFMMVSPIPQDLLDRYGLIVKKIENNNRIYKDVLVHFKNYSFSELDKIFIEELQTVKKKFF
ncbi:MAG: LysR family transcriptional regulator [Treponemataceae bacterium]